jgi:hypothetical protein
MHSIFNILRTSLLTVIAAWSLIVLGLALHFQTSFVSSDALMFVPLAVFAAIVTLLVLLTLLLVPCISKLRPITQTRWELVWIGFLSVFWLALCAVTTNPAIADSEVVCWAEEDGVVVDDDVEGYSNEVYHARYRVLQAFAFLNMITLLGFFLFILALALWHHFRGRYIIWTTPTTIVGWFDGPSAGKSDDLPRPVTDKRKRYGDKDGKYRKIDEEMLYTSIPAINRYDSRKGKGYESDTKPLTLPLKVHTKGRSGDEHKVWVPLPTSQKRSLPVTGDHGRNVSSQPAPPIARKFSERRQDTPATAPQHERRPSQRERFDQARQDARRDRAAADQALGVGPRRQDSSSRRPHAHEPATTAPAIARKPSANAGRARPEAPARPDVAVRPAGVQRHGSSSRPQQQQQQQYTTGPGIERQPTNPFARPSGRRA